MPDIPVLQIDTRPALPVSPATDVDLIAGPGMERTTNDQIEETVSRLARRYTRDQISIAELANRVRASYNVFATARIRSFVSIFVERLVRRSIETPPTKP